MSHSPEYRELLKTQRANFRSVSYKKQAGRLFRLPLQNETLQFKTSKSFDILYFIEPLGSLVPRIIDLWVNNWAPHDITHRDLPNMLGAVNPDHFVLKTRPSEINKFSFVEDLGHQVLETSLKDRFILCRGVGCETISLWVEPADYDFDVLVSSDPNIFRTSLSVFEGA